MADQEKEYEHRDLEMGTLQYCSMNGYIYSFDANGLTFQQQTIKFINDEASSVHGNLRVGSIYTSESGEWKLGGFEILSSLKDDEAIIYVWILWANI